jgi:hypothetical protein
VQMRIACQNAFNGFAPSSFVEDQSHADARPLDRGFAPENFRVLHNHVALRCGHSPKMADLARLEKARRVVATDLRGPMQRNHPSSSQRKAPSRHSYPVNSAQLAIANSAGADIGPTLARTLIRGLRLASGVVTPGNHTQMPSGSHP